MPRLPDVQSLGQRRTPRATRGVQDVRAAGAGFTRGADIIAAEAARTGTGLVALGQDLTSAAKVLEAGRLKREAASDKLATARAKSQFLIADLEIRNSFEGDQEYQTYGSRYETVAKEACDTAAEGLRDEVKGLFTASCEGDIARGRVQVAKQARKMEVGVERGRGAEERDALKQAYLQEQDPQKRIEILNANRAAIEARVGLGYYTPEEGVEFGREDATDFPVDRIGTLPAQERLGVLTEGMTRAKNGQPIFLKLDKPVDRVPIDKRVEMIDSSVKEIVAIRKEARIAAERAEKRDEKALKERQEFRAAELTDGILEGRMGDLDLDAALKDRSVDGNQFITLRKLLKAQETADALIDDDSVVLALTLEKDLGILTSMTVINAFADKQLTRTTMNGFLAAIARGPDDFRVKEERKKLRENVGGVTGIMAVLDAQATRRVNDAMDDFDDRVRGPNAEDPRAVRLDIETQAAQIREPSSFFRPRYLIGPDNDDMDAQATKKATLKAFRAGQITREKLNKELELIKKIDAARRRQ